MNEEIDEKAVDDYLSRLDTELTVKVQVFRIMAESRKKKWNYEITKKLIDEIIKSYIGQIK